MRRREEKLRCSLRDAAHPAQLVKIACLHIEMRGYPLYKHPLKCARLRRLLRQHHHIRAESLLKTYETALQSEQQFRTAEDHEGENRRNHSERHRAHPILTAVPHGKETREPHSASPLPCT